MANIEVCPETNAILKQYAQEKGCNVNEAAEKLIDTAAGRLSAVRKYAQKIAKEAKPKVTKAKKTKKAKAAPAKE